MNKPTNAEKVFAKKDWYYAFKYNTRYGRGGTNPNSPNGCY